MVLMIADIDLIIVVLVICSYSKERESGYDVRDINVNVISSYKAMVLLRQ